MNQHTPEDLVVFLPQEFSTSSRCFSLLNGGLNIRFHKSPVSTLSCFNELDLIYSSCRFWFISFRFQSFQSPITRQRKEEVKECKTPKTPRKIVFKVISSTSDTITNRFWHWDSPCTWTCQLILKLILWLRSASNGIDEIQKWVKYVLNMKLRKILTARKHIKLIN